MARSLTDGAPVVAHMMAYTVAAKPVKFGCAQNLSPATNVQRWALEEVRVMVIHGIGDARWKLVVQGEDTVPTALLVLLVFWLVLLFASYGLFAPRHATTMVVLLLSSAATAGAIVLIIDLERPIGSFVGLSAEPMKHAVAELSR